MNQRLAKLGRVPILGRTITTKAMPVPGNGGTNVARVLNDMGVISAEMELPRAS